jgi:hypothetical protein
MNQHTLKTYIRKEGTTQPRGVAVIVKDGTNVRYGYSLTNLNLDKFDKKLGTAIALARATSPSYQLPKVPERETAVLNAFEHLQNRAIKYFKDVPSENIIFRSELAIPF